MPIISSGTEGGDDHESSVDDHHRMVNIGECVSFARDACG